jgi:uncharacterized protein (DUF697 family)
MAFYDPLLEKLSFMKNLTPTGLKKLADVQLSDLVVREAIRAKKKIDGLNQRYPTAGNRELAQRLVDGKKGLASVVGGVSGVFGVISVPADLLAMVYLQLTLLVEIATLYKVNLKSERARQELVDVFGYANGVGPLQRSSPKLVGSLAAVLLAKGGLNSLGRVMPLVSAPISAYLNNQHIQAVGDEAVRHYDGFLLAAEKTKKASEPADSGKA